MTRKFVRRDWVRFSKIGKGRKKLQKWRKPKGRDSKMRLKRRSYPAVVSVGYRTPRKDRGKIDGKEIVRISNLKDLNNFDKGNLAILAKVGAKKKQEIIKKAQEMKIKILNVGGKNETRK